MYGGVSQFAAREATKAAMFRLPRKLDEAPVAQISILDGTPMARRADSAPTGDSASEQKYL